jgi:hypothetical protein
MHMQSLPQEVRRIAGEVLLALAGEDVAGSDANETLPSGSRLACCVRIEGPFRGQVLVHATPGLTLLVARRMFGHDPATPFAAESQEALREITNILAGNIKPLLGKRTQLFLPEDLPLDAACPPLQPLAESVVEHAGQRLEVRVFAEM